MKEYPIYSSIDRLGRQCPGDLHDSSSIRLRSFIQTWLGSRELSASHQRTTMAFTKQTDVVAVAQESEVKRLLDLDTTPWYKRPNLRRLYFCLVPAVLGVEMTSGYDGSILNGLQAVKPWLDCKYNAVREMVLACRWLILCNTRLRQPKWSPTRPHHSRL